MSKKTFASAPKPPRQPSAEEIESFETSGRPPSSVNTETRKPSHTPLQISADAETRDQGNTLIRVPAETGTQESGNTESQVPVIPAEEPIVRLTIDLPESAHARFKAVCAATRRKMVQEVRLFIERRTCELESEARL